MGNSVQKHTPESLAILDKHTGWDWYLNMDNEGTSVTYLKDTIAEVYARDFTKKYSDNPQIIHTIPAGRFKFKKAFIGNSPKHGEKYLGNTILLQVSPLRYIFITPGYISKFSTRSEIVDYVSDIGNNSVPYPYAVDKKQNYYLIVENAILKNIPDLEDPYKYYYEQENPEKEELTQQIIFSLR